MSDSDEDRKVYGAAAHLPEIWAQDPAGWFRHIEAQFNIKKIMDKKTRYFYAMSKITADLHMYVEDVDEAQVTEESYDKLKTTLIDALRPVR